MTMKKKLLVAAGTLLAATIFLFACQHIVTKRTAGKLESEYCDPEIKTHANPIIFVHGMHEGKWVWEGMSDLFCRKYGYSTFRFNLREHKGRGLSSRLGSVDIFDYVADVKRAIAEVTLRYKEVPILVGHSMGGLLALQAGSEDSLKSLVLIAPAPPKGVKKEIPPWALKKSFVSLWKSAWALFFEDTIMIGYREMSGRINEWDKSKRIRYHMRLVPESAKVLRDIIFGSIDVTADSIAVPVLVVSGSVDDIVPIESSRETAKKYGASFIEMKGNGHLVIFEPGWDEASAKIRHWLEVEAGIDSKGAFRKQTPLVSAPF